MLQFVCLHVLRTLHVISTPGTLLSTNQYQLLTHGLDSHPLQLESDIHFATDDGAAVAVHTDAMSHSLDNANLELVYTSQDHYHDAHDCTFVHLPQLHSRIHQR